MRKIETISRGTTHLNALSEVRDTAFAPALSSAGLRWNGFCLERHCISGEAFTSEICFPTHIIGFLLKGGYKKDIFDNQTRRRTVTHASGSALLYPKGLPHIGHSFSQADFLVLYLEPAFVERTAQESVVGGRVEIVPQPKFEDKLIGDILGHLLSEVENAGATGVLFAESLATALAAKLIRNFSTAQILPPDTGGLPKYKLRRALEFINDNFEQGISLEELAQITDLSPHHFARQFKQSTGHAPHQYHIRVRVKKAKELLADSDFSITEIALQVGCASQSHLSKLFRQVVGISPREYRRSR